MQSTKLQTLQANSYLSGGNASYVEHLYENFLNNPESVEEPWRQYFQSLNQIGNQRLNEVPRSEVRNYFLSLAKNNGSANAAIRQTTVQPGQFSAANISPYLETKRVQLVELIDAYRRLGHYHAKLDPLNLWKPVAIPQLDLAYYGFTQADLTSDVDTGMTVGTSAATLGSIYQVLQNTYCNHIGIEYMHLSQTTEIEWFQRQVESVSSRPSYSNAIKKRILNRLIVAEGLEKYLGAKYVGQKRFSLEGAGALIPMLDGLVNRASEQGVKEIIFGMAHRGRLNVLVNILGKPPEMLFKEFDGYYSDVTRSGDVKYHMGYASDIEASGGAIRLVVAFNPSHLEIIDPVVEGSVRARQQRHTEQGHNLVVPVLIHGDAAFAAQGVVMETLALSQTRGYGTGGTIHVVINNQVGFTTSNPHDARSSYYCTDIAKMISAPVLHVNGDDAEAVLFAMQLAYDYRMIFNKDVVIDLVCYRRHGHNEADEPAATQPIMYQVIKQLEDSSELYAKKLIEAGIVTRNGVDAEIAAYRQALDDKRPVVNTLERAADVKLANWGPYLNQEWTAPAQTAITHDELDELRGILTTLPEGFVLQPQVAKEMESRIAMLQGDMPFNWGCAETLAYASLIKQGYTVRLSGQDSGRGTFAHRHAVLHDYKNGQRYIPLQHVDAKKSRFEVIDSLLSEVAVLGFEYGYSAADPNILVIWEAQFGDFANGAQVVADQFISSAEQKWGRLSGLTLFLPHGLEGMGPEHSSARLERYLQLCAQKNMQVCVPSTAAQFFHMLRRQMLRPYRKPLIVMTPKSLLRNKLAASPIKDLLTGQFNNVIPETASLNAKEVRRVILCSGKVYYDLLQRRDKDKIKDIAIVRVEQLYPFPYTDLQAELQRYAQAKQVFWCQEEPENQGAWFSIYNRIMRCLVEGQTLTYIGRPAAASPATGFTSLHLTEQAKLVETALS